MVVSNRPLSMSRFPQGIGARGAVLVNVRQSAHSLEVPQRISCGRTAGLRHFFLCHRLENDKLSGSAF